VNGYQTKSQRGAEFLKHEYPRVVNICAVGFDIVGYSKMPPPLQLQSIQKLNKFAKDAVRDLAFKDFQCIYIPTGDGMYLILEETQGIALPLVARVQKTFKEYLKDLPAESRHSFRTGLHFGPVFRYSDINENLNYAGNGINIAARVLGFGSEWHILASREAREFLITHGANPKLFIDAGVKYAKHDVSIHIYNVFEHDKFGSTHIPR
jgi:hypothetical protein